MAPMDELDEYRSRLAALDAEGAAASAAAPASMADCRSLQERLRKLKREILARLLTVRANVHRQARRSLGPQPTLGELWDRRDEGAKQLLDDVQLRVTGLLRDEEASAAVETWAGINQEIDARLARLEELERRLGRSAGEQVDAARPAVRPRSDRQDAGDDDLYAAVGAAAQQGAKGAFCSHCGQGIDPQDRFCRRCGHHLR